MVDYNRDGIIDEKDEQDYWDDDYFLKHFGDNDDFFKLLGEDEESGDFYGDNE
ncbi:MAG: hypothetical protein J5840_09090 [Lachnospiraceae bacterium]|nr:hypothetical protein [Lachnospiraceae bacterium]